LKSRERIVDRSPVSLLAFERDSVRSRGKQL
jgi:hypothetical protein